LAGSIGIGGQVTGYVVPDNLKEPYGQPMSFHLFFAYARHASGNPSVAAAPGGHIH
jgi:hypothetical protein